MDVTHTIRRLGHLGDGIADGPLFVQRTLPGEVVTGEIAADRIGRPRIVTPAPERVRPPCPHYTSCGGCALQHAADDFVATWKEDVVRAALSAQGVDAPFRPILTSPPRSRRRATLAVRRAKSGAAIIGFHAPASDQIVDAPECHLLHPALLAARPALAEIGRIGASRKGALSVALQRLANGLDASVTGAKPLDPAQEAEVAALCAAFGILRLTWNGEGVAQLERPLIAFDGITVSPPPGAFLQATEEGEEALRRATREAVGDAARIVDLFAGCGTFALPLAREASVHAVEGAEQMAEALDAGWRGAPGLKRVTTEARDLFRRPLEPDELNRFDAAVIDPPRAGALAQTERLAHSSVARIAAVSCNPQSFARDARLLQDGGYRLDWVQVIDQFRWSSHVELAACFSRGHTLT